MDIGQYQVLDRVSAIDPELNWIETASHIPHEDNLFQGHFPGHPLFPGTLQTEVMAQALGALLWHRLQLTRMPYLIGIDGARFRREVPPGATLTCHAKLTYLTASMAVAYAEVREGAALTASSQVRLALTDFPNRTSLAHARHSLERLGLLQPPSSSAAGTAKSDVED